MCLVDLGYCRITEKCKNRPTLYRFNENNTRKNHIVTKVTRYNDKIRIEKGARQGYIISPKLFASVLEEVFLKLRWEHRGLLIQRKEENLR